MATMKLIKPDKQYAGLSQGWWLKKYWEYVYPRILAAERGEKEEEKLPDPDEGQSGPVMYAVGKYAYAFAEPFRVVKPVESGRTKIERYHMTHTIRRGFVLPFVKFIALESDGDGTSFDELRNAAQSLALDSEVYITFEAIRGTIKEGDKQLIGKQRIDLKNAMDYYCESDPICLPHPSYGQQGYNIGSPTNRAISSSFMAIFEPQEEETYRIHVEAEYIFRDRGRSKHYGRKDGEKDPLVDDYEIIVDIPAEKKLDYRKSSRR
jgi:hypothetical protein